MKRRIIHGGFLDAEIRHARACHSRDEWKFKRGKDRLRYRAVVKAMEPNMSSRKQQIRDQFRKTVFSRDGYKCRICGAHAGEKLDAHHITDRNLMPNGGYVSSNGISLCESCHLKAEVWHSSAEVRWEDGYHPDDLYKLIGSSKEQAIRDSIHDLGSHCD